MSSDDSRQLQYLEHLCLGCMTYRKDLNEPCPCGWREDSHNDQHQLIPGSSLMGRYMVGRVLGEGGFGITYIGWSILQNKKVAIKEFYPGKRLVSREDDHYTVTPHADTRTRNCFDQWRDKFFKESQILAEFDADPNIVSVEDFFKENGTAYIVMEFLEGFTLNQYLNVHGAMPLDEIMRKLSPLVDALERIHAKKRLHRDISPDNIMLTNDGGVKLLDFGAAREFSLEGENANTEFFKAGYTPLEQYYKHGKQGPWTDEHAFAATIYRAVTNYPPPDAQKREKGTEHLYKPSELGARITPEQDAVIIKGMALEHNDRYPSMRQFFDALKGNDSKSMGLFERWLDKLKSLPHWFAPAVIVVGGSIIVFSSSLNETSSPPSTSVGDINSLDRPTPQAQIVQETQPPVEVEHGAVKTLKDFHASITQRKLGQAFDCLDVNMQNYMGGFDSWASGFATTVSSTPLNIRLVEESSERVVLSYTLKAVDNPGGTKYFDGTAVMNKTIRGWKIDEIQNRAR